MTTMENDLRFMEHTEKIVAEMLKSALAPNGQYRCSNDHNVDETIEYVIIDETKPENATSNETNEETSMFNRTENVLHEVTMNMAEESENQNFDYSNIDDLESLISDGLHKIRLEYPMYPVTVDSHGCNCHSSPSSVMAVPSNMDNTFENSNMPYNEWYANSMNNGNDSTCAPIYQNEANRRVYGEEYWEDNQYDSNNGSFDWTPSNGTLLNVTNNEAEVSSTKVSTDCFEDIAVQNGSDEDDDDDDNEKFNSSYVSNTMSPETSSNCIRTKHDRSHLLCNKAMPDPLVDAEMSHLNVNNNLNGVSAVSTATGGAATTHVQICASTPTAIHAAQSTTTTTTSAAFAVLHQQTSCTTTNFVPNNLANVVLATSPAALYAQSILTSTAHQYLNVFRKEIQQFFTNNINYNAGAPNLNLGFYERLLYAQLLQQQILQQQQQQAAIATLLQQQKIAIQNNAAAAAAAACAASSTSSYSNTSVAATSSAISNVDIAISGNEYSYSSPTSLKSGMCKKNNKDAGNKNMVDVNENKNYDASMTAINEECQNSILD